MQQEKILDWESSVKNLIAERCFESAAQVVSARIFQIRSSEDWLKLLTLLELIPPEYRLTSASIAFLYAEALAKNSRYDQLLEFSTQALEVFDGEQKAQILLVRSAGLHAKNNLSETVLALENALPYLIGEARGRALGRMGLTLFQLGNAWEEAFLQAQELREMALRHMRLAAQHGDGPLRRHHQLLHRQHLPRADEVPLILQALLHHLLRRQREDWLAVLLLRLRLLRLR